MLPPAWKMRTRKLLYPTEKVWVDKHKYDEAERLHYEREAALAASAVGPCQELVAVNGFCHEERAEEELKEDLWRVGSGKKHKKRKYSPKAKSLDPKIDFVMAGLLTDHVWFDKPLFDQAESAYHMKLADSLPQVSSMVLPVVEPAALAPRSEDVIQADVELCRNLAALRCTHGSLMACHHIIQDVWVNKFNFDDAEKLFVERSQLVAHSHLLQPPSVLQLGSAGPVTPDEGYVTALATPSTPAHTVDTEHHASASFAPPEDSDQTVNGKPPGSSLRALLSEVWLEKPIYDDAERCFYANMFDGHPPGKVRLQERGRPDSSKKGRKEKKSRSSIRKQPPGKRGNNANLVALIPQEVAPPPAWCFMHPDTESLWFSKPTYDSAEAQFYASQASQLAQEEATRLPEATRAKATQPAAQPSGVPEPDAK